MQRFRPTGIVFVLRRLHVAYEAVTVAVMVDVAREHDVLASSSCFSRPSGSFRLHQDQRSREYRPAPLALVLIPDIHKPDKFPPPRTKTISGRDPAKSLAPILLAGLRDFFRLVREHILGGFDIEPLAHAHIAGIGSPAGTSADRRRTNPARRHRTTPRCRPDRLP